MTSFQKVLVAVFGGALLGLAPAQAAFRDPLWSARSASLGGAYTALGNDPTAVFYNPAATVAMENTETHFTYAKLFAGLDAVDLSLSEFALVQPLKSFNVLTVGWGRVSAAGLRREDTLTVGMAHLFRNLGRVGDVSVGVSGRALSQTFSLDTYSVNDPVFNRGRTRNDFALDLHAHMAEVAPVSSHLSLGLSLRAINQPDVGFATRDTLPMEVALGLAYRWGNYVFPVDLVHRKSTVTPQFGVEGHFADDRLSLRLGSDTHQIGTGLGYQYSLSPRLVLAFDYAFLWPLNVQGTSGSHRATVGVKF